MPKIFTVRKQKWIKQRKPDVARGDTLTPNMAVALRYGDNMARMIEAMTRETEAEIKKLFTTEHAEEFFAEDKSIASQARMLTNQLKKKFEKLFAGNASRLAESFANQSDKASSAQLHASIQKLSGGLSLSTTSLQGPLTDILKATIAENVSLIKSIPQKYLNGVQGAVLRSITTGNGLQDLVPYLAKNKGITLRRARFIAADQTRKAFENLSTGRMIDIGLEEFEWIHTGGSNHPRKEHIAMNGKIYRLSDPPVIDSTTGQRGFPGQLPGCRCRKRPIVKFAKEKSDAA